MEHLLPLSVEKLTKGRSYTMDSTGMSGSEIRIYEDRVLKIEKASGGETDLPDMLRFLEGKLPAPRLLACEEQDGFRYLLMTRIPGEMTCTEKWMDHSEELLKLIAEAFRMLWQVEISDCPRYLGPEVVLKRARITSSMICSILPAVTRPRSGRGDLLLPWRFLHAESADPEWKDQRVH